MSSRPSPSYRATTRSGLTGHIRFAALLPAQSAEHVRRILPQTSIVFARSWDELSELLGTRTFRGALIDPQISGEDTRAALRIVRHYPRTHIFAYVEATAPSLQAIFRLSKYGLDDVFVHPVKAGDKRFLNAIEKVSGDQLASDVLTAVECKLQVLPAPILHSILDLFRRPYRYQHACDLASECGVSIRSLYRAMYKANLGTPRKLITMAKAIHGCCYVQNSATTLREASAKLGYSQSEMLSSHIREHLASRPSRLRQLVSTDELLIRLIEGLNKPPELHLDRRARRLGSG